MQKEQFEKLLEHSEGRIIDYKKIMYDFSNDPDKGHLYDFIKDIISFSNTIRSETSYIVIGIKYQSGEYDFFGLQNDIDEAELQAKAKAKIHPKPYFNYHIVNYNEKKYGVFEFPVHKHETLLSSKFDYKNKVGAGIPYHRIGSMNESVDAKTAIEIHEWLKSLPSINDANIHSDEINNFLYDCTDSENKLTDIIIDVYSYAKKNRLNNLLDFCKDELSGIAKDVDKKYRYLKLPFSVGRFEPYQGMILTPHSLKVELEKYNNYYTDYLYLGFSISDIENKLIELSNSKLFVYLDTTLKTNNPKWKGSDQNITFYLFHDNYKEMVNNIRKELIRLLMEV